MNQIRLIFIGGIPLMFLLLTGCQTLQTGQGHSAVAKAYHAYNVPAHRPNHPGNVRVYVSLNRQIAYVMEGSRPLLVMPVTVGKPGHGTPTGQFRIGEMNAKRRAVSHGFYRYGDRYIEGWGRNHSGRSHVGTPMPYWCGLAERPNYGFHTEWIYPEPRSHGCIRMHCNVAPKFFALVRRGTPVNIARSQSYDATLGASLKRPPSPASLGDYSMQERMSDAFFTRHQPVAFE
jgi:hypothetical protein